MRSSGRRNIGNSIGKQRDISTVVHYFCKSFTCSFNTYLLGAIFVPCPILGTRSDPGEQAAYLIEFWGRLDVGEGLQVSDMYN